MGDFFQDNGDLKFYVDKAVDWAALYNGLEGSFAPEGGPEDQEEAVQLYREIVSMMGPFAADEIAPRASRMDREGARMVEGRALNSPGMDEIMSMLKEMGYFALNSPRELGGMNAPNLCYYLVSELMARGDVSTMTHYGFHCATAGTLLAYSMDEGSTEFDEEGRIVSTRFEKEISEIISGETWGSMDLTEPGAGSDLSKLRAKAKQDDDGLWRVSGNKIFITSGNGGYHLVLAKTRAEESLKALSLFLVPTTIERHGKSVENAVVDRLEEKIGHHASPTCSVQFDESVGELIGQEGEGLRLMFMLMNHARLGVGFEAIGLCEAAYREARAYAEERQTMGRAIAEHPMIADYLDEMDVSIRGLRAIAVAGAMFEEQATLLERRLIRDRARGISGIDEAATKKEISRLHWKARNLTPLLKYRAAEEAVRISRMAMQILGGNGYTKDYAPERLLRDALVMPVYEGTSQIQALMVLKDVMGRIMKNPQRFLAEVANTKVKALRATDPLERALYRLKSTALAAERHIVWKVAKEKFSEATEGPWRDFADNLFGGWDPRRDFDFGFIHAEHLTNILTDLVIAETLWAQTELYPERREIVEAWLERVEPRARYHLDCIQSTGERVLRSLKPADEEGARESA